MASGATHDRDGTEGRSTVDAVGRVRRLVEASAGWTRTLRGDVAEPAPEAEPEPERAPTIIPTYDPAWEPTDQRAPTFPGLISQACTAAQIDTEPYAAWCERFGHPHLVHRKQWEWCYLVQALTERDMVRAGSRGLGFGVGTEPIASLLAAEGCELVATDLPVEHDDHQAWATVEQHAESIQSEPTKWHEGFAHVISGKTAFFQDDNIPTFFRKQSGCGCPRWSSADHNRIILRFAFIHMQGL